MHTQCHPDSITRHDVKLIAEHIRGLGYPVGICGGGKFATLASGLVVVGDQGLPRTLLETSGECVGEPHDCDATQCWKDALHDPR